MRSGQTNLAVGGAIEFSPLLRFDSGVDGGATGTAGRVLQIGSQQARAFDARLEWTADGGVSAAALISVAAGTSVGVFARTLQVGVRNLDTANTNIVTGVLSDGFVRGCNVYQVWYPSAPTAASLNIPAWARSVTLQASNASATGSVSFLTAGGTTMGIVDLAAMPSDGAIIGGASTIEVTCSHPCRVVYHLTI